MKKIRVLLADDHTLVRAGIRALLERVEGVEIVAEAGDGRQTLELIERYRPDVVLLDLSMPTLNGLEVLKEAREKFLDVRFIVLTVHDNDEYAIQALRSGAAGFIPKSAASTDLETALTAVLEGEDYLSPQISQQAILKYLKSTRSDRFPNALTPRQREILQMIAQGYSTKKIAQRLNITVKTVESHRTQLMERLGIYDIAGLVKYAIRTGLVQIDE